MDSDSSTEIDVNNDQLSPIKYHYLPKFNQQGFCSYVGIIRLDGIIDLTKAANLLPVNVANQIGQIQAIKYDDIRRGITRGEGTMKNMIIIDICLLDPIEGQKMTNIMIGPSMIKVSGLKSDIIAEQACHFMQNHLFDLQTTLFKYTIEQHYYVIQWLLYKTQGPILQAADGSSFVSIVSFDLNQNYVIAVNDIEIELPIELVEIYLRPLQSVNMIDWQKYNYTLARCLLRLNVYDGDLGLIKIDRTNFLYNYALGCQIDRRQLAQLLNNYNGFDAKFNNLVRGSVYISLGCGDQ